MVLAHKELFPLLAEDEWRRLRGPDGEGWERATTSIEDDGHGSQAHYVNCCSAEDRSSTTGKVGKS